MNARVLVVDDEEAIRSTMKQAIDYAGHDCLLARSGQEGLDVVERESPDVVFLDIKMPGMDGLEVLKRIKEIDDTVEVVIISGHGTMETAHTATKLGAFSCLSKPIETDNIFLNIRNALEQRRLKTEVSSYRELASIRHEMVGDSPALKEVTEAISRAAPTSSTVLVHGESGVGKELVARAVHRNSRRGKERFVQVNCAALPEELIESELFGHERGGPDDQGGRTRDRRDQPEPGRGDRQRHLPRGPVFSAQCHSDPGTTVARSPRGYPTARRALRRALLPGQQLQAEAVHAGGGRLDVGRPGARQRARAPEHGRAPDGHDAGRDD